MDSPDDHRRLQILRAFGAVLREVRARRRRNVIGGVLVAVGAAMIGATLVAPPAPRLVWNASASAPRGLYLVAQGGRISTGDMVVAWLPRLSRRLAARRHYLPFNIPLVKRVVAIAGDEVCASGDIIRVNDRPVATRRAADSLGRPLPRWAGCTRLRGPQMFLLMDRPDSFDGRYFGVTEGQEVIGKARLIWRA